MATIEDIRITLEKARQKALDVQAGIKTLPATPTTPTLGAGVGAGEGTPQDYSAIWTTEYGKAGLEDVKTKIAGIDTDISTRKATRDKALLTEKGKPIPQWMITGRKKLEIDAATGDLNRLIDERNTLAGQYNTGIEEVTRKVSYNISYQQEMRRQLETTRAFGLEEKLYELRKTEAEKPTEYAPPASYKEWELAGKPGTFEDWLATGGEAGVSPVYGRYRDRLEEEINNMYSGVYGKEFSREKVIEILKREFPDTDVSGDVYARAPDGYEAKIAEVGENVDTYAWAVLRGEKSLTSVPDSIEPQVISRLEELKKTERVYTDEQIKADIRTRIAETKAKYEEATDEEIKAALVDSITRSDLTDPDRERFNLILNEILPEEAGFWEKFWTPPKTVARKIGEIFK